MCFLVLLKTALSTFVPVILLVARPCFLEDVLNLTGIAANGAIGIASILKVMFRIASLFLTTGASIPVAILIGSP